MPEPPVHLALRSTQGVSARVGNEALVNLTSPTTATEVNPQMDVRNSKLKLALGAASLFLFLVGLKRTFRTDDGRYIDLDAGNGPFQPEGHGSGDIRNAV